MISSPKQPAPPDPKVTGAAQQGANITGAMANAHLQNVDSYSPEGSVVYNQDPTKTQTIIDLEGNPIDVPKYTATTTYSPGQQALYDQSLANQQGLGQFAGSQIDFLQDYLSKPFDGSNDATEARLMELGSKRLDPMLERQEEAMRTRFSNQGLKPGDEAYDRGEEKLSQYRNDAYNQLLLQGHGQSYAEGLQSRNQPINELTQLMYGSQPQSPQSAPFNPGSMANVDYGALVQDGYRNELDAWQTQQQNRGGLFGSLLGAAGTVGAALPWSDKRLKKNIKKVGNVGGHDIHEYRFKGQTKDDPKTLGVMAQDVEKTRPDAVATDPETGFKKVNYGALFGAS